MENVSDKIERHFMFTNVALPHTTPSMR